MIKWGSCAADAVSTMQGERSRYGLVVSALGAVLLAVSVFLPWYGVSFTASGVALAQRSGEQLAEQFGNGALQASFAAFHAQLAGIAGHEFASLSAHQLLHDLNVVLLVLAGLALLDALVPLARADVSLPYGAGKALVLLGGVAAACVIFRMADPPVPQGELLALSLREGCWLALLGALMMVLGAMWPRSLILRAAVGMDELGEDPFAGLSGWTPRS